MHDEFDDICDDTTFLHEQEYSETFDESTFEIQLRTPRPDLRSATVQTQRKMKRLARMRAKNENVPFEVAWGHIFEVARMRADLLCLDDRRAALANEIWNDLVDLADMRDTTIADAKKKLRGGARAG